MPKVVIDYEFNDLNMEPDEDLDIYIDNELGQAIGFVKVHVTGNGKIVIMANGKHNLMNNIVMEQWTSNLHYQKRISEIEHETE